MFTSRLKEKRSPASGQFKYSSKVLCSCMMENNYLANCENFYALDTVSFNNKPFTFLSLGCYETF